MKYFVGLMLLGCMTINLDAAQAEKEYDDKRVKWYKKVALEGIKTHLEFKKEDLHEWQDPYDRRLKELHDPIEAQKKIFAQRFGLQIIANNSKRPWLVVDPSPDRSGYQKVIAELAKIEEDEKEKGEFKIL